MNVKELKEILASELNLEGFRKGTRGGHLSLKRKGKDFTEYLDFSKNVYGSKITMSGRVVGNKDFHVIENLMKKHYESVGETPPGNTIQVVSGNFSPPPDWYPVETPDDLKRIIPEIKKVVERDILPLFESLSDIKSLYVYIESLSYMDICRLLRVAGSVRRLIIKALVKAPDFEEFSLNVEAEARANVEHFGGANSSIILKVLPGLMVELRHIYMGPAQVEGDITYTTGPYWDISKL